VKRAIWLALFLVCGLVVFLTGMSFSDKIPDEIESFLRPAMAMVFLVLALALRRANPPGPSWRVFYAFFIATLALFLSWKYSGLPMQWLALNPRTPEAWAVSKAAMSICWIAPIILLVKLGGEGMDSLFLHKGKLKRGLTAGLLGFGFFLATSFFAAKYLFKAHDLTLAKAFAWSPWVLTFVLFNAAGEELIFRGLFLKRFGALVGPVAANLGIALVFTIAHLQVNYAADVIFFMVIILPLAVLWGSLMQKTEGIWGSVLFHAGADIPVMLGIFSNLT
jgi:uncharacterized protein